MEKIELNEIDLIFPPQISSQFIHQLSVRLHLPLQKFIDVVGDGPDLFSSSLPYAFEYACKMGNVKSGDTGLVIAVGSGIQVGCAIYQF
jgi:3-oxoacyl-[acyl-carrier-protein] synthase III